MRQSAPAARKRFAGFDLVEAIERRFGLRLQPGLHPKLLECAQSMIESGQVENNAEMIARIIHASESDPIVVAMRNAASIGETYFFRDPRQLRRLEDIACSELIESKRRQGDLRLRVWSAACATGEEAYTMAILFKRAAPDFDLQVVGTDMNEAALDVARAGVYRKRSFRQIDPRQLRGWIHPVGQEWKVDERLRSCVSFTRLNLVTDRVPAAECNLYSFDVVVCRNVLIYLDQDKIPEVVERMAKCSNATSILVFTPAEYAAARYATGYRSLSSAILLRRPVPEDKGSSHAKTRRESKPKAVQEVVAEATPLSQVDPEVAILHRAREAADSGAFDVARQHLTQLLKLQPDSAMARYLLGVIAVAQADIAGAIREYRQALYLRRGFAAAELGLGLTLARAGPNGEAQQHLRRALILLQPLRDHEVVEGLEQPVSVARGLAEQALARGR